MIWFGFCLVGVLLQVFVLVVGFDVMCFFVVIVDFFVICYNYVLVKCCVLQCQVFVVVKVNVYGYGVCEVVIVLYDDVDGFVVVCLEEVVEVCVLYVSVCILLLEGCFEVSEYVFVG